MPAAPADVRIAYQATVQEALAEWRAVLGRAGARYALSVTDEPYGRALRHLVAEVPNQPRSISQEALCSITRGCGDWLARAPSAPW